MARCCNLGYICLSFLSFHLFIYFFLTWCSLQPCSTVPLTLFIPGRPVHGGGRHFGIVSLSPSLVVALSVYIDSFSIYFSCVSISMDSFSVYFCGLAQHFPRFSSFFFLCVGENFLYFVLSWLYDLSVLFDAFSIYFCGVVQVSLCFPSFFSLCVIENFHHFTLYTFVL